MLNTALLGQIEYKDHQGNPIAASEISFIAPYKHIADGFYNWCCVGCGTEHSNRSCGWPIAGQVLRCSGCGSMNLLVKTNTIELDQCFGKHLQLEDRELTLKIKEAQLSDYVPRATWDRAVVLLRKVGDNTDAIHTELHNVLQSFPKP